MTLAQSIKTKEKSTQNARSPVEARRVCVSSRIRTGRGHGGIRTGAELTHRFEPDSNYGHGRALPNMAVHFLFFLKEQSQQGNALEREVKKDQKLTAASLGAG